MYTKHVCCVRYVAAHTGKPLFVLTVELCVNTPGLRRLVLPSSSTPPTLQPASRRGAAPPGRRPIRGSGKPRPMLPSTGRTQRYGSARYGCHGRSHGWRLDGGTALPAGKRPSTSMLPAPFSGAVQAAKAGACPSWAAPARALQAGPAGHLGAAEAVDRAARAAEEATRVPDSRPAPSADRSIRRASPRRLCSAPSPSTTAAAAPAPRDLAPEKPLAPPER